MSTGGHWPLQKGVYAALGGSGGLAVSGLNLGSGNVPVYDEPPVNAGFPFVTIGEDELEDHGTITTDGFTGFFKIYVWSQGERGRSTVKQIADAIYAALHKNSFSITGFTVIVCRFASSNTSSADGISWCAEMKFSIIMQAN